MPIYEYQCVDCGQRIERLQRVGDPPPGACEACGGAMERQLSAPAFQFKGSGWYVTDYADRKGGGDSAASEASSDGGEKSTKAANGATDGDKAAAKPAAAATPQSKSGD